MFSRCSIEETTFKIFYSFIFRERGREGEREGEKHQCVVAFCMPPVGNLAHNSGVCPDWELNSRPFGLQAVTQSTTSHQPGLEETIFNCCFKIGLKHAISSA